MKIDTCTAECTLEELTALLSYGVTLRVKRADTGTIIIQDVSRLANSKDARQMAKWQVFKTMPVHGISPSVNMASVKRDWYSCIYLAIDVSVYKVDYDNAAKMIKGET